MEEQDWRTDTPERSGVYLREYLEPTKQYLYCRFDGRWWYCGHAGKYRAIAEMEPSVQQDLRWRGEKDAVEES